jgi:hypothetical protein
VGGESLGVAECSLAGTEGSHAEDGDRQRRELRLLSGANHQPCSSAGKSDRAHLGSRTERGGTEEPSTNRPGEHHDATKCTAQVSYPRWDGWILFVAGDTTISGR